MAATLSARNGHSDRARSNDGTRCFVDTAGNRPDRAGTPGSCGHPAPGPATSPKQPTKNSTALVPGSSDFGDVSQAIPAFWYVHGTHSAKPNWHSAEVAAETTSDFRVARPRLPPPATLATSVIDPPANPELLAAAAEASRGTSEKEGA